MKAAILGRVIGIRPLAEEKYRPAFALLEIAGVELTIEQWCEQARRLCLGEPVVPSGISCVETERGHIYGLFSYILDQPERPRRRIRSDYFVAPNYHGAKVTELMVHALEDIAQQYQCEEIVINLSGPVHHRAPLPEAGFGSSLSQVGFRLRGATFTKQLGEV